MSTPAGGKPPSKRAHRVRGPNRGQTKTKIVVRRLPANLPEAVFLESIKAHVSDQSLERPTTWVAGKVSKNPVKGNTLARAYIYFKNAKLAADFQKVYHGHAFMDKHGNEGRAYVEFAPFQKVPREQRKADSKQGMIEDDPDYQEFLKSLTAEPTEADKEMKLSGTELLLKESALNPKSTPLLEDLRAQKAAAQAKLQANRLAARQARQGKAGLSNSSKAQITILANRNAKDTGTSINNSRASSNNPSGSNSQHQQNAKGHQGQAGQKSQQQQSANNSKKPQSQSQSSAAETDNTLPAVKPKRERKRRERGSKKAEAEAAAAAAASAPAPQITLLKPAHSAAPAKSPTTPATPGLVQIQPRPSNSSNSQTRGQQKQNQQQQNPQQQQQNANAPVGDNVKQEGGRSGRTRKPRGEKARQEPKIPGAASNGASQPNSGANGAQAGSNSKPTENGSGGSSRPSRTRRGRGGGGGGGGDNPASSAAQG